MCLALLIDRVLPPVAPYPPPPPMQLSEVGSGAQSRLHAAVEYVNEHMPPVVHTDESLAERESQALLDEAMGRLPTYDATAATAPRAGTELAAPEEGKSAEHAVAEANKPHAAARVAERPRGAAPAGGAALAADAALGAPEELKARMDAEEVSAKTPLAALSDKLHEIG